MDNQNLSRADIDGGAITASTDRSATIRQRLSKHSLLHSSATAWIILAISLLLTMFAWQLSNRYIQNRAADRFEFRVNEVVDAISSRLVDYQQVLNGGIGFYAASTAVDREEWRTYITNLNLGEFYPGVQGIGVSVFVQPEDKSAFEASIREEGFEEFSIKPEGDRELYSSIIFLEPFDWRNQRAFGFDMYCEPNRRAAMSRAITTGQPTVSAMVTLVQETDQDPQKGFLVYLPLYKKQMPLETEADRWRAAMGFVYAPFRADDLMKGILQSGTADLQFEIFDGNEALADRKMYDSDQSQLDQRSDSGVDFTSQRTLPLDGRDWTLKFYSEPEFIGQGESWPSLMVACSGLLVDGLLFLVISSIGYNQRRAVELAVRMTAAFRRTEMQFKAVCDTGTDPIVLVDRQSKILYGNAASEKAFQLSLESLRSKSLGELFDGKSPPFLRRDRTNKATSANQSIGDPVAEGLSERGEFHCQRRDGSVFPASVSRSTWSDGDGQFMAVVVRDITERKASEKLIAKKIQELQRSNRDLDDFAYIASHDLRSPLRGIESLAGWVIEDAAEQLPTESRDHLEKLIGRIKFMQSLLSNLLAYSRVGRVSERVQSVDTQKMVVEISNMLSKPEKMTVIAKDLPTIDTLQTPLETCLRNLIDNAIKHHDRDDGVVTVTSRQEKDNVYFEVADDGPGIPKRSLERVFKIFQTLQPRQNSTSGSGVGLSIIKKTIETYGGSISVASTVGQGATFTLRVPKEIEMPSTESDT